jgi:hypothetical protein
LRWKLLIATSLLAAAASAGVCFAVAHYLLAPATRLSAPGWVAALTLVVPLGAITYASIFVYRHTARRRAIQAAATALLSILLTLTALTLYSILARRPAREFFPAPPTKTT